MYSLKTNLRIHSATHQKIHLCAAVCIFIVGAYLRYSLHCTGYSASISPFLGAVFYSGFCFRHNIELSVLSPEPTL